MLGQMFQLFFFLLFLGSFFKATSAHLLCDNQKETSLFSSQDKMTHLMHPYVCVYEGLCLSVQMGAWSERWKRRWRKRSGKPQQPKWGEQSVAGIQAPAAGILGQVTYTLHAGQPAIHRALPSQHNNTVDFSERGAEEAKTKREEECFSIKRLRNSSRYSKKRQSRAHFPATGHSGLSLRTTF